MQGYYATTAQAIAESMLTTLLQARAGEWALSMWGTALWVTRRALAILPALRRFVRSRARLASASQAEREEMAR